MKRKRTPEEQHVARKEYIAGLYPNFDATAAQGTSAIRAVGVLGRSHERLTSQIAAEEYERAKLTILIQELLRKVEHDKLTGLLNREGLERIIGELKKHNIGGCLLLLDIDRFKSINDEFDHDMGDKVLETVSRFLRDTCRVTDPIARVQRNIDPMETPENVIRYGGEEILVFFPNATPEQILAKFQTRDDKTGETSAKINVPFDFMRPGRENVVTFSGGIIEFRPGDDIPAVIQKADHAMYVKKRTGRNGIIAYSPKVEEQFLQFKAQK